MARASRDTDRHERVLKSVGFREAHNPRTRGRDRAAAGADHLGCDAVVGQENEGPLRGFVASRGASSLGGLALASRLEVGRLSFQEAAMTLSDVGREAVRLVSQLTGVAISVPVVAGFVLLGAAVLVGGSLLDVGRRLLETKSRAQEPLKAA